MLRSIGAADFDIGAVDPNRVRHLAGLGRRMKPQTLANLQPDRRYQILVATVVDEKANTSVANDTVRLFGGS